MNYREQLTVNALHAAGSIMIGSQLWDLLEHHECHVEIWKEGKTFRVRVWDKKEDEIVANNESLAQAVTTAASDWL